MITVTQPPALRTPRRLQPRATARLASRAGVTLVEMMIVVVLIGILSALAVPRMDLEAYRLRSGTQSLGTALAAAQRAAVSRQHDVVVAFDAAGGRLRIHDDRNNNGRVDGGELVRWVTLAEGLVYGRGAAPAYRGHAAALSMQRTQDGMPALVFMRSGSAKEEAALYVTSRRAAAGQGYPADTRVLEITRSTGRVSLLHWNLETWEREF